MENSIFLDTLKGVRRERPPVWFMRQAGRVLPSYMKLRETYSFSELMLDPELAAKVTLLPVHDLGVDAAILFSDILVVPQAMGLKVNFTDKGPRFEQPLKDVSDPLAALEPDTAFFDYIYKAIRIIRETAPANIPLIGFCGAPFTVLCYMIQGMSSDHRFPAVGEFIEKRPKETEKIVEMIVSMSQQYALKQIESGIQTFQLFETHAGLIPFEIYKRIFLPAVIKIGETVRSTGTPFIYFPKGIGKGISDMNTGISDALSVDWEQDLADVRSKTGPDLVLQGNLDPSALLAPRADLEKSLQAYLDFGSKDTRWIFNLGHGVLPDTPFENAKFAVDWVRNADWRR